MGVALEDAESKDGRARLVEMTKEAVSGGLTTTRMLMERCESDLLDEIGAINGGAAIFYKKQVRGPPLRLPHGDGRQKTSVGMISIGGGIVLANGSLPTASCVRINMWSYMDVRPAMVLRQIGAFSEPTQSHSFTPVTLETRGHVLRTGTVKVNTKMLYLQNKFNLLRE
eukprot:5717651-Pyramimonas_sp.AAC.1